MVKVLLVTHSFPYPEHKDGVAKINYNLLANRNGYIADLLTVDDSGHKGIEGVKIEYIPFIEPPTKAELLWRWLTSTYPINVIKYERYMDLLVRKLEELHKNYDIVHLSSPFFAALHSKVSKELQRKLILFPIDSVSLNKERMLEKERSIKKWAVTGIELLKYRRFERLNYANYRKTVFVSDVDSDYVKRLNPAIEAESIPNGVDISYFKSCGNIEEEPFSLVFTGDLSYPPNEDAVRFFIEEVRPLIMKRIPLKLYVVGKRPKEWLRELDSEDIVVTGFVEDIRGYIERSGAYISPLRFGSGIKNKVLEAMSMSKVVIGTPISFEGIEIEDGRNCIVVESNPAKMAAKVVEVLSDQKRCEHIQRAARKLIEKSYSWSGITKRYAELYERCMKECRTEKARESQ